MLITCFQQRIKNIIIKSIEIKNDLISNITHEFKTPITTISTAIEGISSFNHANDPQKTKKYLGISSDQLKKLNTMVEKLLETALLDSDKIVLSKERVEVVGMTKALLENFDILKEDKELSFEADFKECWIDIDIFHMRNAINNLIDNAIKYGGQQTEVSLSKEGKHVVWIVSDSGGAIDKKQQAQIFKKFYRIPKGNVHNNPVLSYRGLPVYDKDEFDYGLEYEIEKTTRSFKVGSRQQEHNLIDALKIACRKFSKEKTGKKPFTNINLVRI